MRGSTVSVNEHCLGFELLGAPMLSKKRPVEYVAARYD